MLPTGADLKAYVRAESDAEDGLLADLVAQAQAAVETALKVPLLAEARTFALMPELHSYYGPSTVLYVPTIPMVEGGAGAPVVTDPDGTLVAAADYRVTGTTGQIIGKNGYRFVEGPHDVLVTVGWSAHPAYATRYEPVLRRAILDVGADLYQHRNPSAQAEGSGGGVYAQWASTLGLPSRVAEMLKPFFPIRVR